MIQQLPDSAMLSTDDGTEVVKILHSGDAIDFPNGVITNLTQARRTWTGAGGSEDEFDAAVGYVDSLP
jgi:hypothetical protein